MNKGVSQVIGYDQTYVKFFILSTAFGQHGPFVEIQLHFKKHSKVKSVNYC